MSAPTGGCSSSNSQPWELSLGVGVSHPDANPSCLQCSPQHPQHPAPSPCLFGRVELGHGWGCGLLWPPQGWPHPG